MKTSWWVRFSALIVFVVLAVLILLPTVMKFDESGNYPFKSKINLGLDLQGGLYMVLGIDFKKVYKDEVNTYGRKIENLLKDQEIIVTPGNLDESDQMDPKPSHQILQWPKLRSKNFSLAISVLRGKKLEN
jgi:preprotein translocase subunit SecD